MVDNAGISAKAWINGLFYSAILWAMIFLIIWGGYKLQKMI